MQHWHVSGVLIWRASALELCNLVFCDVTRWCATVLEYRPRGCSAIEVCQQRRSNGDESLSSCADVARRNDSDGQVVVLKCRKEIAMMDEIQNLIFLVCQFFSSRCECAVDGSRLRC